MTYPIPVRDAHDSDAPAIEAIIRQAGLFTPDDADGFVATLAGQLAADAEGRRWLVAGDGCGAAYLAPEPASGVWNLLFLGVRPEARRRRLARALVKDVGARLRAEGARLLLIDTSTGAAMAPARALYAALGYVAAAEIPDYWAPGEGGFMPI